MSRYMVRPMAYSQTAGIAVCGSTGEEYAEPFVNAIVCDMNDGRELATSTPALHKSEHG